MQNSCGEERGDQRGKLFMTGGRVFVSHYERKRNVKEGVRKCNGKEKQSEADEEEEVDEVVKRQR